MKTRILLTLLATSLLTGCCCSHYPYDWGCPAMSGQALLNNSGFVLDVFQDGVLIGKNLGVGQVLPIRATLFQKNTVLVVTGHTAAGEYVGSDTHIFDYSAPEAWSINRLYIPKQPH